MKNLRGIKVLSESDMKSITGGGADLPVEKRLLDKNVCLEEAKWLGHYRVVTGMSLQEIAEEIYAHAVFYYTGLTADAIADALSKSGVTGLEVTSILLDLIAAYLIDKSGIINITDGGDTELRKKVYKGVWAVL